jgi:Jacalin-like lectin domain
MFNPNLPDIIEIDSDAIFGGPGGHKFDDSLLNCKRIKAVRIMSGLFIDSIQMECPSGKRGSRHGGNSGQGEWITLAPNEKILSILGRAANFVEYLELRTTSRIIAAGNKESQAQQFSIHAPPGHKVTGFHGRCGRYLDAIGILTLPIIGARLSPKDNAQKILIEMSRKS